MKFIWTKDIESESYLDGVNLRKEVFVEEQNVPAEEEIDQYEKVCFHVTMYDGDQPVATGRILPKNSVQVKFGRVAVRKEVRGTGLGRVLMEEMEKKARELGYKEIILGGQVSAVPFYEKLDYTVFGDIFLDGGIDHRMMKKEIGEN
ncbi:MAG: GNAT family N-acetyltransferase [Gallicola sp.]|nr:GNAT family N-acetyltransferase [Gallicola sp.]